MTESILLHRVILRKSHPQFNQLSEYKHYDYLHNPQYSCVEVNNEVFCFLTITYRLGNRGGLWDPYNDMPTYAILDEATYYDADE